MTVSTSQPHSLWVIVFMVCKLRKIVITHMVTHIIADLIEGKQVS